MNDNSPASRASNWHLLPGHFMQLNIATYVNIILVRCPFDKLWGKFWIFHHQNTENISKRQHKSHLYPLHSKVEPFHVKVKYLTETYTWTCILSTFTRDSFEAAFSWRKFLKVSLIPDGMVYLSLLHPRSSCFLTKLLVATLYLLSITLLLISVLFLWFRIGQI